MFDPNTQLLDSYREDEKFDFLRKNTLIPDHLKAKRHEPDPEISIFSAGIGNAAFELLSGNVTLKSAPEGLVLGLNKKDVLLIRDALNWQPTDMRSKKSITTPLAGLILALTRTVMPQTKRALLKLVGSLNSGVLP